MFRLVADAGLVAILLFLSAGTVGWWRAWVLLAVLLAVRAAGALAVYRVNPDLLRERANLPIHKDQRSTDRVLVLGVLATGFLGLPILAGLDVFHWHVLRAPAPAIAGLGLVLFILGWSIKSLALRANAFAVSVVESFVAAFVAVVPICLMVMRLRLEEDFLRRELPGYTAYADRVRSRLIPGIW